MQSTSGGGGNLNPQNVYSNVPNNLATPTHFANNYPIIPDQTNIEVEPIWNQTQHVQYQIMPYQPMQYQPMQFQPMHHQPMQHQSIQNQQIQCTQILFHDVDDVAEGSCFYMDV
ncbi:uncharacterized protein LOC114327454 [Diabrotica virgifera virgifera]|uniref:Uncharacterized protein LOC114327454 isoform X1 n=1 Tax=Diabrotica virgifera virgifera TaxID=50390 RepID=A0A6P7F7W4_DIAVI|nr:uncharacterized protein LOC114327454 [Diabrotica virgifera virgifera]